MSLVHEALQKAEREKRRKASLAPAPSVSTATVVAPVAASHVQAAPAPPAIVGPPRSHQALLTVLSMCVGVAGLVAIVYLVSNATSTVREAQQTVTPTAASAHASMPSAPTALHVVRVSPSSFTVAANGTARRFRLYAGFTRTALGVSNLSSSTDPAAAPAQEVRYKITGITKDPEDGKYLAIINGQLRSENQYVDGAVVKKIERDRVTIEVDGHEQVLRLF